MAKAALWNVSDAEARKRGEQTGLDTLVVHALNDGYSVLVPLGACDERASSGISAKANALSTPPGEYDRKVETQRN